MLSAVKKVLDWFLEILLTVVMTVLVLDVVWQVFTRYVLNHPSSWSEELATFLMIWVGMLGASVALNRGAHLGIDYFVGKLSARTRLYTEVFVFICIGLFSFFVMFLGGFFFTLNIFRGGQISPALGLKMGYVYLALPISGFFLVFYSIELLIEKILLVIRGQYAFQKAIDSIKPPSVPGGGQEGDSL
ncbi:MAG: TRAP transporter small permease [Sedimentisphaerales bacterium]|nr:TRAP transporter small permease [Sedimentisphaerales bacterium]